MNIYVGNLPRELSEADLQSTFESFGEVASAKIIKDKFTGEARGFGFVEMPNDAEAKAAIEEMHGKDLQGRTLTVNEARPKRTNNGPRRSGGGFGGQGGGGGRGGFGGNRGGRRF